MRAGSREVRNRFGRSQGCPSGRQLLTGPCGHHGKRGGQKLQHRIVNIRSVDFSQSVSQIEGLQKSLVLVPPAYNQLKPLLKLKISGPCKWNQFQPQTHEKTQVYKVSKERFFFSTKSPHQVINASLLSLHGNGYLFFLVHYFTIHGSAQLYVGCGLGRKVL